MSSTGKGLMIPGTQLEGGQSRLPGLTASRGLHK